MYGIDISAALAATEVADVVALRGRRCCFAGENADDLRSEDADLLVRMEKLFGVKLAFRADANYHVENFKIINALTGEEYR